MKIPPFLMRQWRVMNALFEKILPLFKHKIVFYGGISFTIILIIGTMFVAFKPTSTQPPEKKEEVLTESKETVLSAEKTPLDVTAHDVDTLIDEKGSASPKPNTDRVLPKSSTTLSIYEPFKLQEKKETLTLIITDLGLDSTLTEQAIRELPASVMLGFSSYAKTINQWIQPARAAGHHVLLQINKEDNTPHRDVLTYFDGVLLISDNAPVRDRKRLRVFLDELDDRGKIIVEGRLLKKNCLALENNRFTTDNGKSVPLYFITHTLTEEGLFMDHQDIFQMKGIVTFPAILVPYLIDLLDKKAFVTDPFQPLLKSSY